MAQYPPAITPTRSQALQAPITLQSTGGYIQAGAPGGPVVYSAPLGYILPIVGGSPFCGVTGGIMTA